MHSPKSPFGDILNCPVCFFEYDGRIMQCHQGHAVCEKCYGKLKECPHCRSVYVGTRNFVLEELITKLKGLSFKQNKQSTSKKGATAQCTETTNKPKTTKEAPDNAYQPYDSSTESAATTTTEEPENFVSRLSGAICELIPHFNFQDFLFPNTLQIQCRGLYICRMLGCSVSLPICRLLNHLRCFHKQLLLETTERPSENGFTDILTVPAQNYRKAYQLKSFGIFFFILNVTKHSNITTIKSWVQCACPNNDARNFRFSLKVTTDNIQSTYTDFVYGAQSDAAYIQLKDQCLTVNVKSNIRNIDIEIKIEKNTGPKNRRRCITTISRTTQIAQPQRQNQRSNNAAPVTGTGAGTNAGGQRSNNRRNKKNRRR